MAHLSWEAPEGNPISGDPAAFAGIARDIADTALNAGEVHANLNRLAGGVDGGIWRGEAADSFREELGKLPSQLESLHASSTAAAEALGVYGRVLADLQEKAGIFFRQAEAVRVEEATQTHLRDRALTQAPVAPTAASDDAIAQARDRFFGIQRQLHHLHEQRLTAETVLVSRLEEARDLGIRNDGGLERVREAVEDWIDERTGLLRGISDALKAVSGIAGLLSFIPVLVPIFGSLALGSAGAAFALDATLVATGNGSRKTLAMDAAFMAFPVAGKLASRALMAGRAAPATREYAMGIQRLKLSSKMRPNAVAILHTRNFRPNMFKGASKPQMDLHPWLQEALDRVPMGMRSATHGKCAEIKAIDNALNEGARLKGSVIATRRVRSPGHPMHGTPHEPCSSCKLLLKQLKITYVE